MKRMKLITVFTAFVSLAVIAGCEKKTVVTDVNAILNGEANANVIVSQSVSSATSNEAGIENTIDDAVIDNTDSTSDKENEVTSEDNINEADNTSKEMTGEKSTEDGKSDEEDTLKEDTKEETPDTSTEEKETEENSDNKVSEDEQSEENTAEANQPEENSNEEEELVIPPDFDPSFYAEHNPDVVEMFGDSPEALYKHYHDYGQSEGRLPSAAAGNPEE